MLGWRFNDQRLDGTADQPWGSYRVDDLELAILVEYAEELLSFEPEVYRGRDMVKNHPPIHSLLNTYHAKVIFTGVSIDLPTLQTQICAIIFIPDDRWIGTYPFKIKFNEEWSQVNLNDPARLGVFTVIKPDTEGREKLRPDVTVPSGAAAFWYGVDEANKRYDALMQEQQR